MRFATPFVTVCFLAFALGHDAVPLPAAAADNRAPNTSLVALLAKARGASGAPYRYHIVSRSKETHDGSTFDVTTETQGLKYLATSCLQALCTGFYFDGEHSYNTNLNGTPLPVEAGIDGLQITLRAIASYAFTDPQFVATGGTLIERDPVLRDGKKFRRISVAPRFGALLDAIVDPATGFVAGVISDERKYAFEFSDERRLRGDITLPFSISLNGFTFTKFDQRSIAASSLEAPAGVVPSFANATDTPPLAMHEHPGGDAPVVDCTIGGQAVACLIDTGDSGLSMSLDLAKKLRLAAAGGKYDVHGAGRYVSGVTKAPALTVGGATYPSAHYVVLHDLSKSGYDVILGADAFANARVTLDYGKRVVAFAPSDPGATGGMPIAFENFVPVMPITVDGHAVTVQIDTGDEGALDLSKDFIDRHPEFAPHDGAANVRVGSVDFKDQPVAIRDKLSYNGTIGSALLQHAVVTLDYAHATVSLAVPRS